jgi:hypothetical protein
MGRKHFHRYALLLALGLLRRERMPELSSLTVFANQIKRMHILSKDLLHR